MSRHKSSKLKVALSLLVAFGFQALLFTISWKLENESEVLFSLIYIFSVILTALFIGSSAGILGGLLAALSMDYHYGPRDGITFFLFTLLIVQLTLAGLRILQQSVLLAETEKKRAQDAMNAREEILSIVAHDLRQPLSTIGMRVELMQNRDSHVDEQLAGIKIDVNRINRMIEDLLDLANIDSKHLSVETSTLNLGMLVFRVVDNFKGTHPNASFRHFISDKTYVKADSDRTQQVLANLISNAIKYGIEGSEITIQVLEKNNFVETIVTNFGEGLSQDQIAKIFQRFVRTDGARASKTKGLGLGLYITKGIVEAQGGKIWVESQQGQQTSFHFTIPIAAKKITQPNLNETKNSNESTSRRKQILIVDDSTDSLQLVKQFLEKSGAHVTAASSSEVAMTHLRSHRPDIIISDIEMPKNDGYDFLKQIRLDQNLRDVPVVALTAHSNGPEIEKIKSAGFHEYLAKPISFSQLSDSIQRLT